jgi:hypothetical protein
MRSRDLPLTLCAINKMRPALPSESRTASWQQDDRAFVPGFIGSEQLRNDIHRQLFSHLCSYSSACLAPPLPPPVPTKQCERRIFFTHRAGQGQRAAVRMHGRPLGIAQFILSSLSDCLRSRCFFSLIVTPYGLLGAHPIRVSRIGLVCRPTPRYPPVWTSPSACRYLLPYQRLRRFITSSIASVFVNQEYILSFTGFGTCPTSRAVTSKAFSD